MTARRAIIIVAVLTGCTAPRVELPEEAALDQPNYAASMVRGVAGIEDTAPGKAQWDPLDTPLVTVALSLLNPFAGLAYFGVGLVKDAAEENPTAIVTKTAGLVGGPVVGLGTGLAIDGARSLDDEETKETGETKETEETEVARTEEPAGEQTATLLVAEHDTQERRME